MPSLRLLVTSVIGSPTDPANWSGTASRLVTALREHCETVPCATVLGGEPARRAQRWDALLGLEHPYIHGPARRWQAGRIVRAASAGCDAVLHLSTYDVRPLRGRQPAFLFVDTTYDLWERQTADVGKLSRWQRRIFRTLERAALRRVDHVFTTGRHVANNFVEAFGVPQQRCTVVGTGLGDVRPFHGPKDYSAGRLLTVAKLRQEDKGLPVLLAAFQLARRTHPGLQLTVVGGQGYAPAHGLPGVTPTGWISGEALQALFETATLFVMPARYEPWGISYLEALACRTPIVGLERNAFPEISDDGRFGFLLRGEPTAQALAQLLNDALSDPVRLARMGADGQRACLARYGWQRTAAVIAARISQALAR